MECQLQNEGFERVFSRYNFQKSRSGSITSIYWALLTENRNLSVKREWVEHIVRATQAEKFLTGNYELAKFIH